MIEGSDGPYTTWSDPDGSVRIVAADADCIASFLDNRDDSQDWRCLGSPDQADEIFVAVHRSVRADALADLAIHGERLLPADIAWRDIDRDGLALFTNDSGNRVLSLG